MRKLALIIALVVLLVVVAFGQDETKYTSESVARLSFLEGKAFLQRASDLGYEDAVLNLPVTEGDRLSAAQGRVEVFLGRSNYLRLDQNTKVDILNLPRKGYDRTRLRAWAGNIYLNINGLEKEKNVEIHTSDVSVYVLENGLYRIDVQENEGTEVMVFRGLVEAAGEEGSNMINSGQRAVIAGGRFTTRPTRFVAAADDSFGKWNESRDGLLGKEIAQRYLPSELEDYESELDQYGDWHYLAPYGNVWVPMGMGMGWHPYYYGRWVWLPLCGWTWLSYDPWGWAPYHYGRWGWDIGLGWYWIPTSIWGPAWVSWWWGMDYFGWAPMGWYGYPLVIVDNNYYDHWDNDYPANSRALTVIRKDQLAAPDVSKVALKGEALKSVGRMTFTADRTIAPRPVSGFGLTRENIGPNQVLLKSTGPETLTRDIRKTTTGTTSSTSKGTSTTTTRKVIDRTSKGTTTQGTQSTGTSSAPRKIRKKDEGSYSSSMGNAGVASATVSRDVVGYPSRTVTSQGTYGQRSLSYGSRLSRYSSGYARYFSSPYSGRSYTGSYRSSSGSSSSRSFSGSRSGSSSHSFSGSRSSGSHSSSSSSGGHVRRK